MPKTKNPEPIKLRPSWKKLKKKLKEKSEEDGDFQEGEYNDESYNPDNIIFTDREEA